MTTTSNLYAEKVFAEHPIGLWSLDEQVDYVSLISEAQRDISTWTITDSDNTPITGAVESFDPGDVIPSGFPTLVFEKSLVSKVTVPDIVSGEETISMVSPALVDFINVNEFKDSFSISSYVYPFAKRFDVTLGFEYTGPSGLVRETKTFYISDVQQWAFVTSMFNLPEAFEDLRLVFEVTYSGPTGQGEEDSYFFLMHGITFGQWSEQFHVESLGVTLEDINTKRTLEGITSLPVDLIGVSAEAYGLQTKDGYYISDNNTLCAINSGLPLVYGATNSTRISYNTSGNPSLVIPGMGFMNNDGRYKELTLEMWIKIQSSATTPKRIVGPVSSLDGLYVNDAFLNLRVGSAFGSYYVSEWDRPMLMSIRISGEAASLTINGEEVISLTLDNAVIEFPEKFSVDGETTYDHDWIGFYAHEDVPSLEIDCVGIYPYTVPNILEKRRLVYGQGVEIPENIGGSDIGTSVIVDYTFANYAKNYIYPDIGRWSQGINENLTIENTQISVPEYPLPSIVFNNKTTDQWYTDSAAYETLFGTTVNLRPNSSWNSTDGYLLFPNFGILDQDVKAFYALFESNEAITTKQILFMIENQVTGDGLEISLDENVVSYVYKYMNLDGTTIEELLYTDVNHIPGGFLFVGLDIEKFANAQGGRMLKFFGAKQELKFYVGGNKEFTNTFLGNIFRVGFCTARNLQKISSVFTSTGVAVGYNAIDMDGAYDAGDAFFGNGYSSDTAPNAQLIDLYTGDVWYNTTTSVYNVYNAELANGTWVAQATIPSTYWAYLADGGDSYFGNLNTGYDEIVDGGGVYSLLVDKIFAHIASYTLMPKMFLENFVVDVAVNGYWQDYIPLSYFGKYVDDGNGDRYHDLDFIQFNVSYPQINKFLGGRYDTSDSIVKTYVSFQYLKTASTVSTSYFTKTERARKDGVIEPGADWAKTKYEVVNDMVIYAPANTDYSTLALVVHIEVFSNGAKENPVKIQTLQLSSQALNAFVGNPVGTRYGLNVYPYRKTGEYFDYKGRNPFSIYKGSTPYLYLTSNSGLRLRGSDKTLGHGISIPINKNKSSFYKASAFQMVVRFEDEVFPSNTTEAFEIQAYGKEADKNIKFYLKPDTANLERARLFAINGDTGLEQDGIMFYINGKLVSRPYINLKTWTMIGLVFNSPLDFSGNVGALRFNGPLMFNNVSHYQSTQADEASRAIYRRWTSVKANEDETTNEWNYWKTKDADEAVFGTQTYTWRNVLFISTENFETVDGATIYKKFTGTDRITIDTDQVFRLNNYQYQVYTDLVWRTSTVSPA